MKQSDFAGQNVYLSRWIIPIQVTLEITFKWFHSVGVIQAVDFDKMSKFLLEFRIKKKHLQTLELDWKSTELSEYATSVSDASFSVFTDIDLFPNLSWSLSFSSTSRKTCDR